MPDTTWHNLRAVHELEISVNDVAKRRELRVIDIRPRCERWAGMGLIPGSVSPRGTLDAEIRAHLEIGVPVVLTCLTGRRSLGEALHFPGGNVRSMEGGLLRWQAAGLPVLGADGDFNFIANSTAKPPQLSQLKRALVACFVAEVIEAAEDDDVDPMSLLDECFSLLGVDPEQHSVGELLQVVEWAAARSRELGNGYERIASNTSMFLHEMQPLCRAAGE